MDAMRLKPVFDPRLPESIRRRLDGYYSGTAAEDPTSRRVGLYRQDETPYRWPASRVTQVAGVDGLLVAGLLLAWWAHQVTAVAIITLIVMLVLPVPVWIVARVSDGWGLAAWFFVGVVDLAAIGLSIFAGEKHHPWAPGEVIEPGVSVHEAVLWVIAVFLIVSAAMLGRLTHPALLAARHRSRYRLPEDYGQPERKRLSRVRAVVEEVREAQRELGGSFDADAAIGSLAELEWRMAGRLLDLRTRRAELDEQSREAATDRVRQALRPRSDAVTRAYETIDGVIARVEEYGADVRRAVVADREYRQLCRIAAEGGDEFPDAEGLGTVPGDLETAAVWQAREELVQRLIGEQGGWDALLR